MNISGLNLKAEKSNNPVKGDVYYDVTEGAIHIFDGSCWLITSSLLDSKKIEIRESIIDSLLADEKFEPEHFGFKRSTLNSFTYTFKYGNNTCEVIEDIESHNFTITMDISKLLTPTVYYHGNIPTNNFALELFKNMNFSFLPIVQREIKMTD